MPSEDTDVDRLYQLPLAKFTEARNALAKARGKAGAGVRKLSKPSAPAWAVNQLHWHKRAAYDRLVKAARALREAHRALLSGERVDLGKAEGAHTEAIREAADEIRAILKEAGESPSPATMQAVTDTLRALPGAGDESPGRLTKPLKPQGIEALAGLMGKGRGFPRPVSAPESGRQDARESTPPSKTDKAAARREAAAARRAEAAEREAEQKRQATLRAARAAERAATAALTRARQRLKHAQDERDRLADRLRFMTKQIDDLVDDVARCERDLNDAAAARVEADRT